MLRSFLTLATGEVIARALYVLAFLVLARALGKTAFGQFGFALTVTSYLVLAVQQGIDQIAVRDVSRERSSLETYVRGLFGLRLSVAALVFLLLFLYTRLRIVGPPEGLLLLILGLTCFSTAMAPRWAFQVVAPKQLAIAGILSQLIFFGGVLLVRNPGGMYLAAAGQLAGDAAAMIYLLHALKPLCGRIWPLAAPRFWFHILKESWPVSVSSVLGIVVYNFDLLALRWLAGPAAVGVYFACYRCATVFSPLLSMLQFSILPAFARAYPDLNKVRRAFRSAAVPTLLVTVVTALVLTAFPFQILRTLYGAEYVQGVPILQVLAWSLPFQGLRSILRQMLVASHLQRRDTINMACAAFTSVSVDLLLIPRLGPLACAISTVLVESVLVFASSDALRRTLFQTSERNLRNG